MCELAIAACDLAEVVGSAIALKLLFGIPMLYGVLITALDVLLILLLQHRGFRAIETLVIVLVATIGICFAVDLWLAKPHLPSVWAGFMPTPDLITNHEKLYIAIGILGATVMPHNLYLHSSIVQTRRYETTDEGKREAIRFSAWDSAIALTLALFINAAILIVSAATFHQAGLTEVASINDAFHLLTPLVGTTLASIVFGLALLASGQNSTLTGTLAGQIVMEGFLDIRLPPWLRLAGYEADRRHPGRDRHDDRRRTRNRGSADFEPGHFVAPASVCGDSPRPIYRKQKADGSIRQSGLDELAGLVRLRRHRRFERVSYLPNLCRLKKKRHGSS